MKILLIWPLRTNDAIHSGAREIKLNNHNLNPERLGISIFSFLMKKNRQFTYQVQPKHAMRCKKTFFTLFFFNLFFTNNKFAVYLFVKIFSVEGNVTAELTQNYLQWKSNL